MTDIEIQRCTRHCAVTGRRLEDGEEYFTELRSQGADLERVDYSVGAWTGPRDETISWWKSRVPTPETRRARWAPNDVLLEVFQDLLTRPEQADKCYVMALLLVRRRILRLEDTEQSPQGEPQLALYCPRDEKTYHAPVQTPDDARIEEIQRELEQLLFAGGEPITKVHHGGHGEHGGGE
jgi:hypothetical protein